MTSTTDNEAGGAPRLPEQLREFLSSFNSSWNPGYIGLFWVAVIPVYILWSVTATGGVARAVVMTLAALLFLAVSCLVSGAAGWKYGQKRPLTLRQSLRLFRARARSLFLAVLFTPLAVSVLLAVLSLGCLVALIPGVGKTLAVIWLVVAGLPLGAIVGCLLLLGVPAVFLMVPAAALDFPDPFDVASRAISYVRGRPLSFLVLLAFSVVRGLFAALLTAVFVFLVAATLLTVYRLSSFQFGWDCEAFREALSVWPLSSLSSLCSCCDALPGVDAARLPDASSTVDFPRALTFALDLVGCLVPASFLATLSSSSSRVYLYLRWRFDQEPPSALVRPDETFQWDE